MKRIRFKRSILSLAATLIVLGLNVNEAMAFNGIGNNINSLCAADMRTPAKPFNGNCTLCHDNGGSGGSGAGKSASRPGRINLDFFCTLPMMNNAPLANAGPNQSVTAPVIVTLDGSGSSDMDPTDTLTYNWVLTAPAGSAAMLSDATAVMPTFTADIAGTYQATLTVDDGTVAIADSVTILATKALPVNLAPVANAGMDQPVITLVDTVFLDGRGSSDPENQTLTYSWGFTSTPIGSGVMLSGATTARPSFTPDVDGDYTIELIVTDTDPTMPLDSAPDSVVISATSETTPPVNIAPVANAGMDQNAQTGATVMLDGNGSSDANMDALSYNWTLKTLPMGSTAALMDATTATPSFVADMAGDYVAQLIVTDINDVPLDSDPDTVMIHVIDQPMNTPDVTLKLKVKPSMLKVEMEDLGEKEVKVKAKIRIAGIKHDDDDDDDDDEMDRNGKSHNDDMDDDDDEMDDEDMTATPVLVDIYLTSPDGTMEMLTQQHHTVKETAEVKTKFMPAMVGEYIVEAIVSDEAGNELASETKTVTVMVVEEDMDDEDEDEDEDDDKDEHKKGKGKGKK